MFQPRGLQLNNLPLSTIDSNFCPPKKSSTPPIWPHLFTFKKGASQSLSIHKIPTTRLSRWSRWIRSCEIKQQKFANLPKIHEFQTLYRTTRLASWQELLKKEVNRYSNREKNQGNSQLWLYRLEQNWIRDLSFTNLGKCHRRLAPTMTDRNRKIMNIIISQWVGQLHLSYQPIDPKILPLYRKILKICGQLRVTRSEKLVNYC